MAIFDQYDLPAKKLASRFRNAHQACKTPPEKCTKAVIAAPIVNFEKMTVEERKAFIAFQKDFRKGS